MTRPRSENIHQKILETARTVLGDVGFAGFTVEEVAHRSGVAKTTIYRHFPSAHELRSATVGCMVQTMPTPNTGSLEGDLGAFMSHVVPITSERDFAPAMLGMIAAAATDPELEAMQRTMMDGRLGPLITIIDLAKARGELPQNLDLDLALDFIEGPMIMRTLIRREPIDETAIRRLVTMMAAGLVALNDETDETDETDESR